MPSDLACKMRTKSLPCGKPAAIARKNRRRIDEKKEYVQRTNEQTKILKMKKKNVHLIIVLRAVLQITIKKRENMESI